MHFGLCIKNESFQNMFLLKDQKQYFINFQLKRSKYLLRFTLGSGIA